MRGNTWNIVRAALLVALLLPTAPAASQEGFAVYEYWSGGPHGDPIPRFETLGET